MDLTQKNQNPINYFIISVLTGFVFILAAFFLNVTLSINSATSIRQNIDYTLSDPHFWLISVLIILSVIVIYVLERTYIKKLSIMESYNEFNKKRMNEFIKFSDRLINEDFTVELQNKLEDDKLAQTLVKLKNSLKENKESETKRREDDRIRNQTIEGISYFGELLRNNIEDPDKLYFLLIKDLSKYIQAIQGGIFILDDTDANNIFFDLKAFFAYNRKKFAERKIKWGDGLIGTCAIEKKYMHLKEVPESYIQVTSGLGETNPQNLLLVPLLREDKVYGVLEFASLNDFTINHISFIEQVADSIASTMASLRINQETARLLDESKKQAEILSSQEEELRQNMEELKATQEAAERQALMQREFEESIDKVVIRADLNRDGVITWCNTGFVKTMELKDNFTEDEINISDLIDEKQRNNILKTLKNSDGREVFYEKIIKFKTFTNRVVWLKANFLHINTNNCEKIILIASNINQQQQIISEFKAKIEAGYRVGIWIETDIHGNILTANDLFKKLINYSDKEITGLIISDLFDNIDVESFLKKWESVLKGVDIESVLRIRSKTAEDKWIYCSIVAIYDINNVVEKVLITGRDISAEKTMEQVVRDLTADIVKLEKDLKDISADTNRQMRLVKKELNNQYRGLEKILSKYESLLRESVQPIIIISSTANRVEFFNHSAETLWGYEPETVNNKQANMLFANYTEIFSDRLQAYSLATGNNKLYRKALIRDAAGDEKEVKLCISTVNVNNENVSIIFVLENEILKPE